MPAWLKEGNTPSPDDTELRSLWKINDLALNWAQSSGKTVQAKYLLNPAPSPADTEARSLQKINACLFSFISP